MCSRQVYDEDMIGYDCPDQPICNLCYAEMIQDMRMATMALMPVKVSKAKVVKKELTVGRSVYELTLTSTKDDPYELRQWFVKIVASAMFEVKYWEACIELQKNGNPHIHAVLYSNKKHCDQSKVKKLGFPYRYEMKIVRNLDKYLVYMKKDLGDNIVNAYCSIKGIPQYWKHGETHNNVPQGAIGTDIKVRQEKERICEGSNA